LQKVLLAAIEYGPDFTIPAHGAHRTIETQKKLVKGGTSWTLDSKHLELPSRAVDVAPYPVDWKDRERFMLLAGYIKCMADSLGVKLIWGGTWRSDLDVTKRRGSDLGHFELADD